MTCNYRYGDGRCASGTIAGQLCVGEGNCSIRNPELRAERTGGTKIVSTVGEGTLTDKCMKWCGLFCPKHRMFYCAAEGECGGCGIDIDDYMDSLAKFKSGRGR
ncbi:MAG: hypothetical protein HZB92_02780 [Euryarchaeota archaeon]|nr:hypothetical protein [Euryarchaeota archaeon]